jgi:B-cell receptor-associated protein 31
MIQLLSTLVITEGTVALLLMINIPPFRKLLMKALDRAKMNSGPAMIKTLAGAMVVILVSSLTSIMKIQARTMQLGAVTPTDQILLKTHMLEASLMGYALFLGLVIHRLHHFLRKIRGLRTTVDTLKMQAGGTQVSPKEGKEQNDSKASTLLKGEIAGLRQKLQKLTLDCEMMENETKSAEENAKSLQKQAEVFLMEYDRLLEDNQNIQSQLSALDKTSPKLDNKKDA